MQCLSSRAFATRWHHLENDNAARSLRQPGKSSSCAPGDSAGLPFVTDRPDGPG